jgi:hypothetical protein
MGGWARVGTANAPMPSNEVRSEIILVSGNSIFVGNRVEYKDDIIGIIASLSQEYGINKECFTAIVREESNFQPLVCNYQYGCKGGQGAGQLIPSTVKDCERRMKKSIDPFNARQNLECMAFLIKNDGINHWGYPEGDKRGYMKNGQRWGSYDKWSKECI